MRKITRLRRDMIIIMSTIMDMDMIMDMVIVGAVTAIATKKQT